MKIINPEQVQNYSFYKYIMNKVQRKLKSYEGELFDENPVGSDDLDA